MKHTHTHLFRFVSESYTDKLVLVSMLNLLVVLTANLHKAWKQVETAVEATVIVGSMYSQ